MELLAPAQNTDFGKIAINCGADAVYIGGPGFSARSNAHNSVADIAVLTEYAHRYLAKVYVAVNTILLNDTEVMNAARTVRNLYDAGADGVIIQDFGLIEAGLPPMPVIASTQMHNHSVASVQFLEKVGFHRAILARELHPNEIAAIRSGTEKIELEAFVHGALCVSYSGRCYLSTAVGGRSANRGECAQPCRKRYSLKSQSGNTLADGHLLSVKDLCRIDMLDTLIDAGVSSFKIEGRLKNAAYVANVVTAYRLALDAVLKKRGDESHMDNYENPIAPDLSKTFHRGYVDGFAIGAQTMVNMSSPKMTGERLGKVLSVSRNRIVLPKSVMETLNAGDGICFYENRLLRGTRVQKTEPSAVILRDGAGISKGTEIYRNLDYQFVARLEKHDTVRRSPVQLQLTQRDGTITLLAVDANGFTAANTLNGLIEPADNAERMKATWHRQLRKCGDMEFTVTDVQMDDVDVPFAPVSRINEIRREVLLKLRSVRESNMVSIRRQAAIPCTPTTFTALASGLDGYCNIDNSYARRFFEKCGVKDVPVAVETQNNYTDVKVMTSRYCLKRELGLCGQHTDELHLEDADAPHIHLVLHFDCDKCEMSLTYEDTIQNNH
ncbi:MAG: U32 family peptidase [Deltaproteobacteria bacterium]|nr:U32 family peptidase [Deltaproteobacteria bacterium]